MACKRSVNRRFSLKLSLACMLVLLGFGVTSVIVLAVLNHSSFQLSVQGRYLRHPTLVSEDKARAGAGFSALASVSAITSSQFPDYYNTTTGSTSGKISATGAVQQQQQQQQLLAKDVEKFKLALSGGDMDTMLTIVDAFAAAMKRANVSFFLYSGSLIGSWRHHGLVPWDDDVDFVFPASLRPVAEQALKKLAPTFRLSTTQAIRWKVFHHRSPKINHIWSDWSWPFLDISFYKENSTHIWDTDSRFPKFTYKKSDVFPLTHRPFQGRLLPAPRNTLAVLNQTYHLDLCTLPDYNHRGEFLVDRRNVVTVKCEQLSQVFPFVVRKSSPWTDGGCSETLQKNGTILSCCFVDYTLQHC